MIRSQISFITLLLCLSLQTNLYSMYPTPGQLTIPQTKDEEVAHALAIADIKKEQAKPIEQLETKKAVAAQQAELNPVIFKNLPADLQPNVFQFMPMPTECSAALLEHRELKIEHENITAFAQINQNQVATASQDGTLKIWDITTSKQVLELPQENRAITSLIKMNDTTIAFGLENGTIKLWDIKKNQIIATLSVEWQDHISSLLKFSDRYIIAASNHCVTAWDIADLTKPCCIDLPGDFQPASILSKISDSCVSFGTWDQELLILNLSDMKKPTQQSLYMGRIVRSSVALTNTMIAYGAYGKNPGLLDSSTISSFSESLDCTPFALDLVTDVCCLSTNILIVNHGFGFKIWNVANPKNPLCLATTVHNDRPCYELIRLSDTSFACAYDNALHIYAPSAEALEAYYELSLTDKLRVSTLIKLLNKKTNIQFPPTQQNILNNTELALFKKLPAAIKKVLMENFGISYTENADAGDHKE